MDIFALSTLNRVRSLESDVVGNTQNITELQNTGVDTAARASAAANLATLSLYGLSSAQRQNYVDDSLVTPGVFLNSSGVPQYYGLFSTSDYIEVFEGDTFMMPRESKNQNAFRSFYYDADKTMIALVGTLSDLDSENNLIFTVPSEQSIKYVRIALLGETLNDGWYLYAAYSGMETPAYFIGYNRKKIVDSNLGLTDFIKGVITANPFMSLYYQKWICYGDSISSYGVNHDGYQEIITDAYNMVLTNASAGGRTTTSIIDLIEAQTDFSHDIATIQIGTNDRGYITAGNLGSISDAADKAGVTFYARFKYLIELLILSYPHQRIGIIAPYRMDDNGATIADAEEEICNYYGVSIFNERKSLSTALFDEDEALSLLPDKLHPSDKLYAIMGRKIAAWMNTL
jgi:lysophospholipase L1-like esterase